MRRRRRPPTAPARLVRWLLSSDDAHRLLDALDDEYVRYQSVQRSRVSADLWYWRQVLRSVPAMRGHARERGGASLRIDLLHLSRKLRRSPLSAGAAVLTLSLTLGTGTAIFAVVDAVLIQPPPFPDPEALLIVGEAPKDDPAADPRAVSYATLGEWRARAGSLATLEAFDPTNLTLTELGRAERVSVSDVTPGFLTLLGVTPSLGRLFDLDDLGQRVAIISDAFWRGRLGADPTVIGRPVVLGGEPHAIVGVLPNRFFFALNASEVWRPMPFTSIPTDANARVRVVARLARGTAHGDLTRALDDVSRSSSPPAFVRTMSMATAIAGDSVLPLGLLAAAAAVALLIAFTNLAVLLMVRSINRRRELAVRSALGARPSETARQLLLEAGALVSLGLLGGVLLALWITPAVARLALEYGGLAHGDMRVSWRGIGVVGIVAFACAFVCALVPAMGPARWRIVDVLRRGATSSRQELSLRRMLVAGEVALAFVLLVSMALLSRSLLNVLAVDPGFDPRGVLKVQVSLPLSDYPTRERAVGFYATVQNSLGERLGADAVGLVSEVPLTGDGGRDRVSLRSTDAGREAVVRAASPGYFEVMRIPVLSGRSFQAADDRAVPPRVVVSESLARGLWGLDPPTGRRVWLAGRGQMANVVGVVGDVKHRALEEASLPTVYLSARQFPSASSIVVVRSTRPDEAVVATVREEVEALDPDLPLYSIRSMQDVIGMSPGVPARRLVTGTLIGFGLLSVILSTIGLFGVMAHDVARRRAELALRMALGADPIRIVRATLSRGALMVASGLAVGGVLSIGAVRGLRGLLFTTPQSEVLSIAAVVAAALMATGALTVLPVALRAARSDPLKALGSE